MLVPVLIFLVCFGGGVFAATRWLPELAEGPVGGMAYLAACGVLGSAVGLLALRMYLLVEELSEGGFERLGSVKATLLASGLAEILFECGSLLALAAIVYVLAPGRKAVQRAERETGSP